MSDAATAGCRDDQTHLSIVRMPAFPVVHAECEHGIHAVRGRAFDGRGSRSSTVCVHTRAAAVPSAGSVMGCRHRASYGPIGGVSGPIGRLPHHVVRHTVGGRMKEHLVDDARRRAGAGR